MYYKQTLQYSLVENGIGDRGAIALAQYLEVTETLQTMRYVCVSNPTYDRV